MQAFHQEGSMTLPTISLDSNSGVLKIVGRSIPEHPVKFYAPVQDWMTQFLQSNPPKIELNIHLDYLNTHSTECILLIMKKLEDYAKKADSNVAVLWNFDEDDEDMQTLGEDLASLVELPFSIVEVKE